MKSSKYLVVAVLAVSLVISFGVDARSAEECPPVTAPPEAFFRMVTSRHRAKARKFYKKHIDVDGLRIAAAGEVSNLALQRSYDMVKHMLAGRPDVLKAMVDGGMYLVIIGKDQVYTDIPEYSAVEDKDYINERVRGTGGRPTSFGEENILSMPIDRYDDESIAVHEFCHTIDGTLHKMDPTWRTQLREIYQNAVAKGLYRDTYAIGSYGEYWAEGVQSYFDCNRVNNWNHGPIGRREQLKIYDPELYAFIEDTLKLGPGQDWRYKWSQPLPNVIAPPAKFKINPYYTKFTFAREFPVVGRSASDEAMLKANDTIRKMFAYRHDILKALMADGLKLVVLGADESISDLPEFKKAGGKGIDHMARFMGYSPETKLLVVDEKNVLADLNEDPYATDCQVLRVFAGAIYHVTGKRPVDPNWGKRLRSQQYELRVQRMDERFDRELGELYDAAKSAGKWKGTSATLGRVEYWTAGVLAYFDAVGQDLPPAGADGPINTREELKKYDPDLYELVHKTMAYGGKVDWRYRK